MSVDINILSLVFLISVVTTQFSVSYFHDHDVFAIAFVVHGSNKTHYSSIQCDINHISSNLD